MTKEEYEKRVEELSKKFHADSLALYKEYILSNTDIRIGDIVSDSTCTIRVSEIIVDKIWSRPYAGYKGVRLTKKLEPFKNGEELVIYNVKNHIKQEEGKK